MDLEEQVCCLELSKKLKELGVLQESLFYWMKIKGYWPKLIYNPDEGFYTDSDWHYSDSPLIEWKVSAFNVAELGELIADGMTKSWKTDIKGKWGCEYFLSNGNYVSELAGTEADARAKMLIYLLENNICPAKK